jgi:hypothetical protein
MITEQDRRELQMQFEEETGTPVINSQDEFDIDYVAWLEQKVVKNLNIPAVIKSVCEYETECEQQEIIKYCKGQDTSCEFKQIVL